MQGGTTGGRLGRGPNDMTYPWSNPGTVSFGSIVGPGGGASMAERASTNIVRSGGVSLQNGPSFLTIPFMLAIGALVWYALKSYD